VDGREKQLSYMWVEVVKVGVDGTEWMENKNNKQK